MEVFLLGMQMYVSMAGQEALNSSLQHSSEAAVHWLSTKFGVKGQLFPMRTAW